MIANIIHKNLISAKTKLQQISSKLDIETRKWNYFLSAVRLRNVMCGENIPLFFLPWLGVDVWGKIIRISKMDFNLIKYQLQALLLFILFNEISDIQWKRKLLRKRESSFKNLHKYILIGELRVRLRHKKWFPGEKVCYCFRQSWGKFEEKSL